MRQSWGSSRKRLSSALRTSWRRERSARSSAAGSGGGGGAGGAGGGGRGGLGPGRPDDDAGQEQRQGGGGRAKGAAGEPDGHGGGWTGLLRGQASGGGSPLADAGQARPERLGHLRGVPEAPRGVLGEGLEDERVDFGRHARRRGILFLDFAEDRQNGRPFEGRPAGQHFIKDRPERIEVRPGVHLLGGGEGLFGGHVAGRADHGAAGGRRAAFGERLGQAEVQKAHAPPAVEKNVGGLDVPVDDPPLVGELERAGDGPRDPQRRGRVQAAALGQEVLQAAPLDVLHDDVAEPSLGADVVDLDDVGMDELRGHAGFAEEALEGVRAGVFAGQEGLDGHRAAQVGLVGFVDLPHAPLPQGGQDLVFPQRLGDGGHSPIIIAPRRGAASRTGDAAGPYN